MLNRLKERAEGLAWLLPVAVFFAMVAFPRRPASQAAHDRFTVIAAALEAYAADNNGVYPTHKVSGINWGNLPDTLTTPIAYLVAENLNDPLSGSTTDTRLRYYNTQDAYGTGTLYNENYELFGAWVVWSRGFSGSNIPAQNQNWNQLVIYDATNGTISNGIILRTQRMQDELGTLNG